MLKVHMMSPAPTKHTSTTLICKGYGSVFCFLSPFSPVLLVVAVNTIRNPIVFRAKIGERLVLSEKLPLGSKVFVVCLLRHTPLNCEVKGGIMLISQSFNIPFRKLNIASGIREAVIIKKNL